MSETTKKTETATTTKPRVLSPAVDIYESRDEYLLVADLPGVQQPELSVKLNQGELSFEGVRKPSEGAPSGQNAEIRYRRTFTLPGGIDADKIEAKLASGVLQLRVPKAAALKPRQINVTVG
jgi:HSP20 family protein